MEATGQCQRCQAAITFAAEDAGAMIACPSCQAETQLVLPAQPPRRLPRPVPAVPKAPVLIEDTLDTIGRIYFVGGCVVGLLFVADCFFAMTDNHLGRVATDSFYALGSIGGGWVLQTVFRALGEIIRLLRKR